MVWIEEELPACIGLAVLSLTKILIECMFFWIGQCRELCPRHSFKLTKLAQPGIH